MSNKILEIGFDIIHKNVNNYSLDNFMIYDNLSGEFSGFAPIAITGYPVRLSTITIISFCTEGYLRLNAGLSSVKISRNQLFVSSPGQIIQVTEISPDFRAGFIVLERDFFNFQDDFMRALDLHSNLTKYSCFDLSESEMKEYVTIFGMIKDKIKDVGNNYRKQIIRHYCHITFYNIYNIIVYRKKENNETTKSNDTRIYERFIKSVEKNYRHEHLVNYYADELCLTPKYLSTTIKRASGKHAAEWIHEYIILEAKALLKSTKMSLQDIADELNFSSPSHFGRFFKQYASLTPKEYRKTK